MAAIQQLLFSYGAVTAPASTGFWFSRPTAISANNTISGIVSGESNNSYQFFSDTFQAQAWIFKRDVDGNIAWRLNLPCQITAIAWSSFDNTVIVSGIDNNFYERCLVFKITTAGAIQWQTALAGTVTGDVNFFARDIRVFGTNGNIYLAGRWTGSSTLGVTDGGLIKLNSSGTISWTQRHGVSTTDTLNAVALDSSENVYYSGFIQNVAYLGKVNSSGTYLTAIQNNGPFIGDGRGLAIDSSNNVFVSLIRNGVVKLSSALSVQTVSFSGFYNQDTRGIKVASDGSVYEFCTEDATSVTNRVIKRDNACNVLWARSFNSLIGDTGFNFNIDTTSNNNLLLSVVRGSVNNPVAMRLKGSGPDTGTWDGITVANSYADPYTNPTFATSSNYNQGSMSISNVSTSLTGTLVTSGIANQLTSLPA